MSRVRVVALLVLLLSTNLVFGAGYIRTNLVSDQTGTALITDPLLVNPRGIALTASSPFRVANNGRPTSALYRGDAGTAGDSHGLFGKLTFNASAATTPIVGTGTTMSVTEGAAFTGTVAVFSDADGTGTYTAMINWGDSSSSTGTIVPAGSGNYLVSGSHTYGEEAASRPITVTINDTTDGASGIVTGSAAIADAPLTGSPSNVAFLPAVPFTARVATFTDADPGGTASDYTATIDWGDATPMTAGTITANGTGFSVTGSHTYTLAGNYTITVTIHDAGGAQTIVTSMAGLSVPALDPRGLLLLALALAGVGLFVIRRT